MDNLSTEDEKSRQNAPQTKIQNMKQTILEIAKCIAWGIIEMISYIARHPEVIIVILITIAMLHLSHAICMSIIYQ